MCRCVSLLCGLAVELHDAPADELLHLPQNAVRANADLLSTAQGGRAARRANRRERNKLFKAISEGNFEDVDLYDDAEDLDDEMIEAMFAEEEERGFGSSESRATLCPSARLTTH